MTFGYNASVVGKASVAGIRDNARTLLTRLRNKRESDGTERRPIVLMGHSMGGIIIKQVPSPYPGSRVQHPEPN